MIAGVMSLKNLRHRICFAFGLLPFLGFGSDLIIAKENVEVVVDAFAQRTLKLAASEMTNYLSRIFSTSVSIVNKK